MLRVLTISLLSFTAHAGRATSAAARAEQWMQAHEVDPAGADQAGMNDLKASDPNAFAIVQALLAKRQLGLLDPKHPSANFAGAHKHEESDGEEQTAADVLRAAPTIQSAGVPVSRTNFDAAGVPMSALAAAEPVHHTYSSSSSSMWNFKAHAAQEDDNLVASVMGDVVGSSTPYFSAPASTGSLISSSRSTVQSSALSGDMATFGFGGQHSMANSEAQQERVPAPAAPRSTGFHGMPTLEWGNRYAGTSPAAQPEVAAASASMAQQTSALASVTQPAPQPAPVQVAHEETLASNPYLNGIDFSSDISKKEKEASMTQKKSKTSKKPSAAELASNPYLSGLNFPGVPDVQPQEVVEEPKPDASLSQKASYLDQINFPLRPRRSVIEAPKPNPNEANPLTTFNWHGDDRIVAAAPVPVETNMMQKVEEGVTAAQISGPLTDWLAPAMDAPRKPAARHITAQLQETHSSEAAVDPMAMDRYNDWVKYSAM